MKKFKKMMIYVGSSVTDAVTASLKGKTFFENKENFEILIAIQNPQVAQHLIPFLENEEVAHLAMEGLVQLGPLAVDAFGRGR